VELLGNIFFYSVDEMEKHTSRENYYVIPVYGDIPCGTPNFIDDEMKGYLEIDSKPGEGTKVTIFIPYEEEK